jgi:glycosyltransferase involved in cell wall biosynthesis
MYEYLAAGVPVVATPLPACVATPGVRVAATPEDMSRAIAEALEEPAELEQDRLATARAASWDRRLRPLLDRLDDLQLRVVP